MTRILRLSAGPRKSAVSNERQRHELEAAFIQHRSRLRDVAQTIVGARDIAEDITQSAYLKVLELSVEMVVRQPSGYLFQVVRHLAIDHRRHSALESRLLTQERHGLPVPATGSPEQELMVRQQIALVEQALAKLPTRTRTAFTWYRVSGLTQREIGAKLGVSATMVNFLIRDAINALKQCRVPRD